MTQYHTARFIPVSQTQRAESQGSGRAAVSWGCTDAHSRGQGRLAGKNASVGLTGLPPASLLRALVFSSSKAEIPYYIEFL